MGLSPASQIDLILNVEIIISVDRSELEKILDSMRTVAEKGYEFIYRQIQEIETAFIERTYVLSIPCIFPVQTAIEYSLTTGQYVILFTVYPQNTVFK